MTCREIQSLMSRYIDGELTTEERAQVDAHLASCDACKQSFAQMQAINERIKGQLQTLDVPASLAARVTSSAQAMRKNGQSEQADRQKKWYRFAAAAVLVIGLAVGVGTIRDTNAPAGVAVTWVEELALELDTFVLSGRSLDLTSTDPNEVVGWFDQKVAFTPPKPIANAGEFRLTGARLCNILGARVASFMFDSGTHRASLYMLPAKAHHQETPTIEHVKDYQILSWTDGALDYALISTAPQEQINSLRNALENEFGQRRMSWLSGLAVWRNATGG